MKYVLLLIIFLMIIAVYLFFIGKCRNLIITILCSVLIIGIIISPQNCINASIKGAELFFYKVFPSVFPFVVISNLIICFGGINIYSKLLGRILCSPIKIPKQCTFVIIVSALCGYPLGAKYTCDLYEKKLIDKNTAERLINIASNAGPLFIIGSIGTSILGNTYLGYLLITANYLSCFIMGIILKPQKTKCNCEIFYNKNYNESVNIGSAIKESVENSIKTCFSIAGFIILFSVINAIIVNNKAFISCINALAIIFHTDKRIIKCFILGVIEMTNGCNCASMLNADIIYKIGLISFFLGFSGFSIISQVYSFTSKINLSIKKYIKRKFLQGIINSALSILLYLLSSINADSISTFNNNNEKFANPLILVFLCILFIIPFLFSKTKDIT
ncbi:MAG: sporulation integral membrane protein YlbJ [Bacillota bacterium]|nr:sporulation integral membrane protein YlbJ [Bacillota bacterium]